MFEKEAEEYAHEHCCDSCKNLQARYKKVFKDGAEFGYNKANEWHYPSKGEYPKDEKRVICILGDFENDNIEVGYYSQVEGDSKRWRFEDYDLPDDSENGWGVSAWKEIVLPSEPMRSLDKEEQKNYTESISKVYKPTGVKLFDKES